MVLISTPERKRCVAAVWRLCLARHRRHYVPFLTMSGNAELLRLFPCEFRPPRAKLPDITRHSFVTVTGCSGRRGVAPQVHRDQLVHGARKFLPELSPPRRSPIPDEFVWFQLVCDRAPTRTEPAEGSSPQRIPDRAEALQTDGYVLHEGLSALGRTNW